MTATSYDSLFIGGEWVRPSSVADRGDLGGPEREMVLGRLGDGRGA